MLDDLYESLNLKHNEDTVVEFQVLFIWRKNSTIQ